MRNKVFDNTSSKAFFNKNCPLSGKNAPIVDYKNINLLRRYMTEKGKILPSRVTQVSTKKQKELSARDVAIYSCHVVLYLIHGFKFLLQSDHFAKTVVVLC